MELPFEFDREQPTRKRTMQTYATSDKGSQQFSSAVMAGGLAQMLGTKTPPKVAPPKVAPSNMAPMMAYMAFYEMNPRASALAGKSDAQYINSGRGLDRVAAPVTSLHRKKNLAMRKQSGVPIGDLIAAEYALSRLAVDRRQIRTSVVEKVSSPFARVPIDTPMRETMYAHVVDRIGRVAISQGMTKVSAGRWSAGFGALGKAVSGLRGGASKLEAALAAGPAKAKGAATYTRKSLADAAEGGVMPGGGSLLKRMGFITLGLPVLATTAKVTNSGFAAASRGFDRLAEGSRFNSAFEELLHNKDAQSDLMDPIEGTLDADKVNKLRKDFGVLNKYAPTVAKDPSLAGRYLETMVYQNQSHGSASEYMRNIKEFTSLEKSLTDNTPGMHSSLLSLL